MALSQQQLTQLAYNAGFRGSALRMAVAVAIAESGGNPRAYNPELAAGTRPGSGSRGLWQIYGSAHPEFNSDALFDPQLNARAAYKVYREAGNSFRPWSTFNNGSAARISSGLNVNTSSQVLNRNAPLAVSAIGGGLATVGGGIISSPQMLTQMTDVEAGARTAGGGLFNIQLLPESITQALQSPDLGKNILAGLLGLLLVIFGFVILARPVLEPLAQQSFELAKTTVQLSKTAATKGAA